MKLKELVFDNIKFVNKDLVGGTIININYLDEPFEFQIPKGTIEFIENDQLILNISNKSFFEKINFLEKSFSNRFNKYIQSVVDNNNVKLKLPFKFSKPEFKVFFENRLLKLKTCYSKWQKPYVDNQMPR